MQLKAGDIFAGRYRLLDHIGTGGFAMVWKAADQMAEDAVVAIKIYAPDKGMDTSGIKLFRREYANVLDINHPHLLTARYFDVHDGSPYLVMSYCPGGSLFGVLVDRGQFTETELAAVLVEV
ncbi:MAG TPA: protein kinase, partial [Saprospiraceae bacterium]|nr:protein kinase [Saprospiraceae bacterium]